MRRNLEDLRDAENADQHDRMVGLFAALCISAATGSLVTLFWLFL